MTQKASIFGDLEMLAGVCSDVLDGKRTLDEQPLPNIIHESVLQALKFAPVTLDFPTKRRVTLGRPHCIIKKENVMINNIRPNNDLRVRPSKKRHDRSLKPYEEVKTEVKKKKKKTRNSGKRGVIAGPDPAPPMPDKLMEMVVRDFDVSNVVFVIQKGLFQTDLEKGENRLSMILKQIAADDFLTEENRTMERRRPDKRLEGIEVDFIESDKDLSKTEMMLKKWDLQSSSSYVLSHKWHNVAERNKLKASDIVQIWFFRSREGKPCFALVNLGRESASFSSSVVGEDEQRRRHCLASQAP